MKKVLLVIMDGLGYRIEKKGNAALAANPIHLKNLWNQYPHTLLKASGEEVGLPKGQMGNSEVGHMNIGAGRLVYQPLELINKAIREKTFFEEEELKKTVEHVKKNHSKLHIMGLISDGGVHSHIDHLMALLEFCKKEEVEDVYLHLFTDGRDVSRTSAYSYIARVEEKLKELKHGVIASIGGRYYAMDRDNNYDRLKKGYDAIVYGIGEKSNSIKEYIEESYKKNITDEFLLPCVFDETGKLTDHDGVIVFNFRKDRLRELLTALTNKDFDKMEVRSFENLKVVTMLPVVKSVKAESIYQDPNLKNIFGETLEKLGLRQLRIAETEKYAHVTFFFDGGKEVDYKKEQKILIPSPKIATYDLMPEMSASIITDTLVKEMDHFDVIILNYANCDMVGHTGVFDKVVEAVKTVDDKIQILYEESKKKDFTMFITADHGNAEVMVDEDGNIVTSHTTSPVPFIVTDDRVILKPGKLGDIAPTILSYMDYPIPEEMTGNILIEKKK